MNPKLLVWWREPTDGREHIRYLGDENYPGSLMHVTFETLAEARGFLIGLKLLSPEAARGIQ